MSDTARRCRTARRSRKCCGWSCRTNTPDGDWNNALTMLMATLKEVDPGGHEITKRIEGLDDVEMQEIFDAGREQGRTEVIEQQRTTTTALTAMFDNIGRHGIRQGHAFRGTTPTTATSSARSRKAATEMHFAFPPSTTAFSKVWPTS